MKPDDPNKNQGISEDDKTLNDKVNHVEKWRFNTMTLYSFAVCKVKNKQSFQKIMIILFLFHILYVLLTTKIVQNYENTLWEKY